MYSLNPKSVKQLNILVCFQSGKPKPAFYPHSSTDRRTELEDLVQLSLFSYVTEDITLSFPSFPLNLCLHERDWTEHDWTRSVSAWYSDLAQHCSERCFFQRYGRKAWAMLLSKRKMCAFRADVLSLLIQAVVSIAFAWLPVAFSTDEGRGTTKKTISQ